jgi:3-methylfumaryl-CoA hydratase
MSDAVDLQQWVGRKRVRTDWINPNRLAAWNATLDRDDPFPKKGEPVPLGFHWTLFTALSRQSELGPDGHAKRGGFLPPIQQPRRMWAGSRLRFQQPLRVGEEVEQVSEIQRVEEKTGRSGTLVFVTVRHTVSRANGSAIEDEQDLVYRPASKHGSSDNALATERSAPGKWRRQIIPDDVLLFRYSALTFNSHRIHYDRRYATSVEGYPGLVVHGPLLATLLLDLVRRELPTAILAWFNFKALRPTFDIAPFTVEGAPEQDERHLRLWSTDNQGRTAVEAAAAIG